MTKILVWLILAMLSYFSLKRMLRGPSPARTNRQAGEKPDGSTPPDYMAKDPVCGTYIDTKEALSLTHQGATYYFCGEDCRHKFLESGGPPGK